MQYPIIPDVNDPTITPKRTEVASLGSANANVPINKLMVNPIPHRIAMAYIQDHETPSGNRANLSFTAHHAAENTPICFPRNKPSAIPKGTGFNKVLMWTSVSDIPALNNAKRGNTPNATQGCNDCSTVLFPEGIAIAKIRPAMVGYMPEFKIQTQRSMPIKIYIAVGTLRNERSDNKDKTHKRLAANQINDICWWV